VYDAEMGARLETNNVGARKKLKPKFEPKQSSVLDRHDDPFATREGKTLVWRDIQMTLAAKGDEPERKLLQDVWGEVPQKETTAVMGPSYVYTMAFTVDVYHCAVPDAFPMCCCSPFFIVVLESRRS
jgi:hypothetical protein